MAYLAPIHRPSSVRHAIKLNFLTPDDESLIVAKANRLEIYAHTPDGLVLQHTKAIYGKVTMLHKLKPATSETDHLFVGTDRYMYFTLSWDAAAKQLKTEKSYRDLAEKASRDSQTGDRCHIDPTRRFMTLEIYEGVVNVLPIAYAGKGKRKAADHEVGELGDTVPVRVPELFVRSSAFVHKRDTGNAAQDRPELALLYEDSQNKMQLKFRELEYNPSLNKDEPALAELEKGQDAFGDVEMGASHLIPLPGPTYGMLIIGETSIAYCDEWDHKITAQPLAEATIFVAWCAIDDQRFCLSDDYGQLYLLFIKRDQRDEYDGWQLDVLGETSRASTLVYLDGGKIFVGSHQGNSQLIQIQESGLEVLQTFANIAPILDFTVMDMGNRTSDAPVNEYSSGQARIVTGSGAYKDGSLRSVRSGVGLEDLGSIGEMAHATEIYSLKSSPGAEFMDTLVVSFVSHTRVFRFDSDGQVEEAEDFKGFDLAESTLYAGSLPDGRLVQVTSSAVLITDADGGMVTDTWRPPGEASITAVAASENHVLVSFKGAALAALDVSSSEVKVQAQHEFDSANQVSCIALSPAIPDACVVGFWQNAIVSFLDLRTLEPIRAEKVEEGGIAVPRSLLVASILEDSLPTLFVGMADGNVVTYSVDPSSHTLSARKSIILGTQQANFRALPRGNGLDNVFATCEHPSLIYGSEGRMVYSAVTAENASCVCPFDSEAYPNAIAIATETELKLALVDEERTTHVQTLPVNETVRRIAYSPDLKAFGLGTIKRTLTAGYENIESHFKLVDEVAFQELHTFALNQDELIESCIRAKLDDGSGETAERFVVGTAYLDDDAPDTAKGRILVFEVTEERRLKLVTEMALKGACRCLSMCQGRIVAALIKTVVIYAFEYQTPSQPFLAKKASYRTATAPIDITVTGDTIAIADLMKSVSIVQYKKGRAGREDSLQEIARHFETAWATAVAHVADNTFLEADAEGNLIVLNHEVAGFSEDDRRRLRITSEMLLGEMVNRIRRIEVQPTPSAVVIPRAFLATVEGSIYLFALIAPGKQDLLMRLQGEMAGRVESPGGVPFARYRGFRSGVRDMGEEGPVRFVDGELVERFLDLDGGVQEGVCAGLGMGVEEVRGIVEGLRRIH